MKNSFYFLMLVTSSVILLNCSPNKKEDQTTDNQSAAVANLSEPSAVDYNGPGGIPPFPITMIDGTSINSPNINGNLVLIFFNPECDHCQRTAQNINGSKHLFKDKQLYFISIDALDAVKKFRTNYGLLESNFHFGVSDVELIVRAMGPISSVPYFYFFKNGKLDGRLEGEKTAAEIVAKM